MSKQSYYLSKWSLEKSTAIEKRKIQIDRDSFIIHIKIEYFYAIEERFNISYYEIGRQKTKRFNET